MSSKVQYRAISAIRCKGAINAILVSAVEFTEVSQF